MTYAVISVPFVLAGLLVFIVADRRLVPERRGRRRLAVLIALAVLAVLTAVFDTIMIATGLIAYDDEQRLGLTIGLAPIEDFLYPLVSALVVPAIWSLLGRRDRLHGVPPESAARTEDP